MNAAPDFDRLAWPLARLPDALEALAAAAGVDWPLAPGALAGLETRLAALDPARCVKVVGEAAGIRLEAVSQPRDALASLLGAAAPAVILLDDAGPPRVLLLARRRGRQLLLLGPVGEWCAVPVAALVARLNGAIEAAHAVELAEVADAAGLGRRARARAVRAMQDDRLGEERLTQCWLLRGDGGESLRRSVRRGPLPLLAVLLSGVACVTYGAEMAGWSVLGSGALDGRLDHGWLQAWLLLVVSLVPLGLLANALQARFALVLGRLLRERVLAAVLACDTDEVRRLGAGHLLARVFETQLLETLLVRGVYGAALAILELACAAWAMTLVAHGGVLLAVTAATFLLTLALAVWTHAPLARATAVRLDLTHDLTERMVGHRTRAVQEPASRRHRDEDALLEQYLDIARAGDDRLLPLLAGIPRGWMLAGLAALAPLLLDPLAAPLDLAIALGAVLLAGRGFGALSGALAVATLARVVWPRVRMLLAPPPPTATPAAAVVAALEAAPAGRAEAGATVLELRRLAYRYPGADAAALNACDLVVRRGERLLVEGPSGGGKSTLAALLAGLRQPAGGLALLHGFDRATLGARWRRYATAAPQFHENHLLSGSLAYNLLLGREWPPDPAALVEAATVCRALGLGPLLERMPGGLMQVVGETGWQLSHGERSRVYLARAILQRADVVVLDESFGALDPASLAQCLRYAIDQVPTLAVIAHP
ncbi:MAG: ATP-binding cassette domain-containing protein [Gammaproteobacteria bacterium]